MGEVREGKGREVREGNGSIEKEGEGGKRGKESEGRERKRNERKRKEGKGIPNKQTPKKKKFNDPADWAVGRTDGEMTVGYRKKRSWRRRGDWLCALLTCLLAQGEIR